MIAYQTSTVPNSPDSAERFAELQQRQAAAADESAMWKKAQGVLESTIGNHPLAAFGLALFTGIAIGWWIKRR